MLRFLALIENRCQINEQARSFTWQHVASLIIPKLSRILAHGHDPFVLILSYLGKAPVIRYGRQERGWLAFGFYPPRRALPSP